MDSGTLGAGSLYVVAVNWLRAPEPNPVVLIAAACDALVDGIDTPALAELAGFSLRTAASDLIPVVARLATELDWEWPPPPGLLPFSGYGRPSVLDRLELKARRFHTEAMGPLTGLAILINGSDWTAGSGMPPADLLSSQPGLYPRATPHTVVIARCGVCGLPECASASVRITRDADLVVWEWLHGDWISNVHQFSAEEYLRVLDQARPSSTPS